MIFVTLIIELYESRISCFSNFVTLIIDLLIETRYTLYVCEIKFCKKIDKSVIAGVSQKMQHLVFPNRFTVRPILIYEGELGPGIKDSDFFSGIIRFEQLLYRLS